MKKNEDPNKLPLFVSKMKKAGLPAMVIDRFSYYYHQVLSGETGLVYNRDIEPLEPGELENYQNIRQIKKYGPAGEKAYPETVRIVLNGGLGTSMGLSGPKSLLKVRNELTFLHVVLKQMDHSGIVPAFMNSFSTHDQTVRMVQEITPGIKPLFFIQHKFPKILQHDFSPAECPQNSELEWNPPGHGDVFSSLYTSGMLKQLLKQGVRYAFISNVDNLGASIDSSLLGYFVENQSPFMMEVAEKTPSDIKGGHLARHKNGRLILRESVQCPEEELGAFCDIEQYRYFNTNNIWINLRYLKDLLDDQTFIKLPIIVNPKTLDPKDEKSPSVYQIESAMGAAISLFEHAAAIVVPRSRFFPVKKTNDLLAIRSDCFVLSDQNTLIINPARTINDVPVRVSLDSAYYGKIEHFDRRFPNGVPSLLDCKSITLSGDIRFEGRVKISGSVEIKNRSDEQAVIREGAVIEKNLAL